MGEKAKWEAEFTEKARQFEEQVRSGGATSSKPPLFKMTPTATEAGHVSPPTTPPPRRSVERLEFMSPTDKWSQSAPSEVPVQQAATTATKTKTKSSNARVSGTLEKGARSDPDDQDPPGPPRKPPSSSGGLGFGFYNNPSVIQLLLHLHLRMIQMVIMMMKRMGVRTRLTGDGIDELAG